ncbi:related to FMP29 Found in Mitochondrial Proteome [Rhynchosporium graminicola]|uniref:Altered inheritance of mitochondria protein 9, mitochondrial n=1 Tax=Rhynchosporium graminicola TaxID=2792576 RepID=A0A1E1L8X2_9HELO|nr:related to FMP29 Found in Mitochondrial Proteome [Rhynchosporium commune]
MDNGSVAIARIPCPNAGPAFKTTASEVATMDFARTILKIPVPKVHAWSAISDNPVEAEYILMEEACGTTLGDLWKDMGIHSKDKLYGNIYFAKDFFPGCEKAVVSGDISEELKKEVEERFAIGPVVDNVFWRRDQTSIPMDRGPWRTAEDYLKALANNQVTWLSQYAARETPPNMIQELAAQESPDAHMALYKKFLKIFPYILPEDGRMSCSTLWHWDLHASNLFVKNDQVASIIDWQSTWAGPLFVQYRYPKIVSYAGEVMLMLPEDYESMEGKEKAGVSHQVERSIVQYFEKTDNRVRRGFLGRRDSTLQAMSHSMRKIKRRYWDEMRHDAACPIHFTEEDLQNHMRDAEGFNEQADFWDRMEGFIARDGWVSNERYEEALDLFANLQEEHLKQLTGEERSDFEKQSRWAERNVDRTDGS